MIRDPTSSKSPTRLRGSRVTTTSPTTANIVKAATKGMAVASPWPLRTRKTRPAANVTTKTAKAIHGQRVRTGGVSADPPTVIASVMAVILDQHGAAREGGG